MEVSKLLLQYCLDPGALSSPKLDEQSLHIPRFFFIYAQVDEHNLNISIIFITARSIAFT